MNNPVRENPSAFDFAPPEKNFSFPPTSQVDEKFLIFTIDEELFAVSAVNVVEAVSASPIAVLPNAPAWLSGIANLRGEIVSVVNLPKILRKQTANASLKPTFIVLRSSFFERGLIVPADVINEILQIPRAAIHFNEDEKTSQIFGQTVYQSKLLNLLDTEKLFAALEI